MGKIKHWLYKLVFISVFILLNGCANKADTQSSSGETSSAATNVYVDPIEPPTGSNFCTMQTCVEEESRTIKSVLRSNSDPVGYGTYVYLIITDRTENLLQIKAATDAFMCNFDDIGEVSHVPIETALFVAKTNGSTEIKTGRDLLESYDLNTARITHRQLKYWAKDIETVGFDDDSNIYLLGSYDSLALFTEDENTIGASLTYRIDNPGSIQVVPLDHFSPIEIATLFKNMRKMYFEDSLSESNSFIGLSKMVEPPVFTFLRTVLRSVPLPSSKAHAAENKTICV